MFKNIIKFLNYELPKEFINEKNVISFSYVGSFTSQKKFNDIDIVIVFKKFSKNIFYNTIRSIKKKFQLSKISNDVNLIINSDFGPIKLNVKDNDLVIHLMMYSEKNHIDHIFKSPFTCFDWERTEKPHKKPLFYNYSVKNILINDFYNARRSINDFISDINKGKVKGSKYIFKKNQKPKLVNFYHKPNKKTLKLYKISIINHTINNFLKFLYQKNKKFKINEIIKFIKNKNLLSKIDIENFLNNQNISKSSLNKFLINFDHEVRNFLQSGKTIYLMRHLKTKYNNKILLGQKLDPSIIKTTKINKKLPQDGNIFSSNYKRTIETANNFFKKKKIYLVKDLKELDYGQAEGLYFDQYISKLKSINLPIKQFKNGEKIFNFSKRCSLTLKKILRSKKCLNNSFIITHNNFIRMTLINFFKSNIYDYYFISLSYGQIFAFIIKDNKIFPIIDREFLIKNSILLKNEI